MIVWSHFFAKNEAKQYHYQPYYRRRATVRAPGVQTTLTLEVGISVSLQSKNLQPIHILVSYVQ
jgi:hypothetical protein